jgi:LPXTG-motif cell wall-anchored protein
MNYLRFTQYAYLLAGFIFAFDAFQKFEAGETNKAYLSAGFALVGVFMFFFRRKFAKNLTTTTKKPSSWKSE